MPVKNNYSFSVFINCPFDDGFKPIFEAIIFTVFDCGFIPRCAKENDDSDIVRIKKIEKLIMECKYGIHDISVAEADPVSGLARFNMPLELGLFLGCKWYGNKKHNEKACLILDTERYRYQKFISDISGQDIRQHENSPEITIKRVRDFLFTKSRRKSIPSAGEIWRRFKRFEADLPVSAEKLKWDHKDLHFMEYQYLIMGWLKVNAPNQ